MKFRNACNCQIYVLFAGSISTLGKYKCQLFGVHWRVKREMIRRMSVDDINLRKLGGSNSLLLIIPSKLP
jgi:hypothetical protein